MKVSDEVGEGHLLLCVLKKIDIAFCLHPHSSSLPTINDAAERATRRFLFALLYFADSVRLKGCRRHNTNYPPSNTATLTLTLLDLASSAYFGTYRLSLDTIST